MLGQRAIFMNQRWGDMACSFVMRDQRFYYVYMMQSKSRRALYIGVTSDLEHRVWQHKNGAFDGFSADYKTHRLVYYGRFSDVTNAIAREKQLKKWRRSKKEWLVTTMNPEWKDLSAQLFEHHRYEPAEKLDAMRLKNTRSLDSRGK
jgi:putative endonuclease